MNCFDNETYLANKNSLKGLAYRITGCASEAEDIVQEVFIKWSEYDKSKILNTKQWLFKVTTNLALDLLKSARKRREVYPGPWLPEPYLESDNRSSEAELEINESVSMALMMVLEKLNPIERVSFILHDIFSYPYSEIAEILDASEAACRKQASRARAKVGSDYIRQEVTQEQHSKFAMAFFEAVKKGNTKELCNLLSEDVVLYSDGGGKAHAAPIPIEGQLMVLNFLDKHVKPSFNSALGNNGSVTLIEFNGSPGMLVSIQNKLETAFQFHIVDGHIKNIYAHRNPDKLEYFR